jgi:hypothetical protein
MGRFVCEQVDHAAFPVDRERHLRSNGPARMRARKPSRNALVELRVLEIQQPVELATSPPRVELDLDLQRRSDSLDHRKRNAVEVAALNPRDQ